MPTESWVSPGYAERDDIPIEDRYANLAHIIFADVINYCARLKRSYAMQAPQPQTDRRVATRLWTKLQEWYDNRPTQVKPVLQMPGKSWAEQPFPTIVYASNSATCGNLLYHTGCIILLEGRNFELGFFPDKERLSRHWHASCIAGISTTTKDHATWVNNLHPLFIAARHFRERNERIATLQHLEEIQLKTGWKTSNRTNELKMLWSI
jgi:hypothetical protein